MKKNFLLAGLLAALLLQGPFVQGQSGPDKSDTLKQYYTRLAESKNEADHALLRSKLYVLLQSDKERDWMTAANFFYRLKDSKVVDSVLAAARVRFPEGEIARSEQVRTIYKAKSAAEKEKLYKAWIKKFPPEKFSDNKIIGDYARNSVAVAYANEDSLSKALQYANMTETPAWRGEGWVSVAQIFIRRNEHLDEAKELLRKAIANSYDFMTARKNEEGAGFAAAGYLMYLNIYSNLLYKEKDYPEALTYVQKAYRAYKDKDEVNGDVNAQYARVLEHLGRDKEAFDKIDEALRAGKATPEMKESLKKLYVQVKGSDAGYDDYIAEVNKQLYDHFMKTLPKKMTDLPAPAFTLTDVNGNKVSLSDYKGKIVILDFWATWCGPCKASFPSMKMAIHKYKDDPDVKFLFIHTWERGDSATEKAKAFITEHHYPFEVLMDLKDAQTGTNKVVESYKVTGIPTKFVIDENGNIRFRFTGFSGGNDAAVEELSAMIALTKQQS